MKDRNIFIYFIPSVVLIMSWVGVLLVRQFSLIRFYGISLSSTLYLLIFFLVFLLGTLIGPLFFYRVGISPRPIYSPKQVERKANWLMAFALISVILLIIKFLHFLGGLSFSISDITELRLSRGRDLGEQKGGTIVGILGMAFSGFSVVVYIYREYFHRELLPRKLSQLYVVFFIGIFVSFLSGGRFAAAIALLIAIMLHYIKKYILDYDLGCLVPKKIPVKPSKNENSILLRILKIAIYISIIYIFSVIFIDRALGQKNDLTFLLNVLTRNLPGIELPANHKEFLLNNYFFIPIYFVISLFQYYIGHAIYQFDVLFSAPYPHHAPYLMGYEFYLHAMFLNKLGFDFMTIQQILSEIPNPGVYFTLPGAFLLDFGYIGGLFVIFLVSVLGSYSWVKLVRKRRFFDVYVSILFLVLILFSPIVAITGTGVYPSLLTIVLVLKFFVPSGRTGLRPFRV